MLKTLTTTLLTALTTIGFTFTAHATDLYRGYYEIEQIERRGLKLDDVKKKEIVEIEFYYVPNLSSYVIFEPVPGRKELFWQHANGLVQNVNIADFLEIIEPLEANFFDRQNDKVAIQNVIGMSDYSLHVSEEFSDVTTTGISRRVTLHFDVPGFEVDLAAISDLTLVDWTENEATFTLRIENRNFKKPRFITLKGRLQKLECVAGGCLQNQTPPE